MQTDLPRRRVGTFTLGVVLILCGALMAVSLFFPAVNLRWALQTSPLILILLGAEVLFAARKGFEIRYDWISMLLCFLLVFAALSLYVLARIALYLPERFPF